MNDKEKAFSTDSIQTDIDKSRKNPHLNIARKTEINICFACNFEETVAMESNITNKIKFTARKV